MWSISYYHSAVVYGLSVYQKKKKRERYTQIEKLKGEKKGLDAPFEKDWVGPSSEPGLW